MIAAYQQALETVGISYRTKEFLTDLRVCIAALVALVLVNPIIFTVHARLFLMFSTDSFLLILFNGIRACGLAE
jgi:hypothetical protein